MMGRNAMACAARWPLATHLLLCRLEISGCDMERVELELSVRGRNDDDERRTAIEGWIAFCSNRRRQVLRYVKWRFEIVRSVVRQGSIQSSRNGDIFVVFCYRNGFVALSIVWPVEQRRSGFLSLKFQPLYMAKGNFMEKQL